MQIFRHLQDVPKDFGPTIVSVGNFDGIHRAHQAVLHEMLTRARAGGMKAMAVTFDPHPTRILRPDAELKLITPLPVKLKLFEKTGIDALLVLPFTRDLSMMTPQEFVRQILVDALNVREVHEGYNFHFGHKASGNVDVLREFGREHGFKVFVYPEMTLRGEKVSSTEVRRLLCEGNVSKARHLLGRVFSIHSSPGRGRGYGHKYTVPTINLVPYEELIPRDGVYITRSKIGDVCFDSVTNVGVRPTFGPDSFAIESHMLNFHPIELMAQTPVELIYLKWIRPEMKFSSTEALRDQIAKDVHKARRFFHHLKTREQLV
ncbi:MAG TPA: bifunctional riboflavin kinase/FAD synthetase [Terriglobales bacterium]|nr:bifunctional riboflavin kinase/FAD synthetase [Terriglobales bacterium]